MKTLFTILMLFFFLSTSFSKVKHPTNQDPQNFACNVTSSTGDYTFTWKLDASGVNPTNYKLEIYELGPSDCLTLISSVEFDYLGNETSIIIDVSVLSVYKLYVWKIIAYNGIQQSASIPTVFLTGGELPVELTYFTSNVTGNTIHLKWQTAMELNNYGFQVERSVEENKWEKIGFVSGKGTSNSYKNYDFFDKDVFTGKYNYRLKQIDNNGESEYSDVIEVIVGLPTSIELLQNYPNPFNPSTNISFTLIQPEHVTLKVFNVVGEEISVLANEVLGEGTHKFNFSGDNLPTGMYLYMLDVNGASFTKKMLLLK